jgi:NAD(P)-dependent dehydrogenase (short-subunit alcohol dehydrogenase family)
MKLSSFTDRVVVITGASSGIGKLAVEEFVKEGAKVVLAARSEDDMNQHLQHLLLGEDTALIVKTDVSDYEQVAQLAETAMRHFGKIDIWINNAATNLYGYTEDVEMENIRRVIDVDLMGPIHGMKVILPIFVKQGFGNIINIGSIDGIVSLPLQSAYDAAKHGMLGFSSALREELMTERYRHKQIDVVDILPASLDTPLNIHAKSTLGEVVNPIPPVYDPMLAVQAIIRHARQPKPIVIVGKSGQFIATNARLMPTITERLLSRVGIPVASGHRVKAPCTPGHNLYAEMKGSNAVRGGFGTTREKLTETVKRHPFRFSVLGLLPLTLVVTFAIRRKFARNPAPASTAQP